MVIYLKDQKGNHSNKATLPNIDTVKRMEIKIKIIKLVIPIPPKRLVVASSLQFEESASHSFIIVAAIVNLTHQLM